MSKNIYLPIWAKLSICLLFAFFWAVGSTTLALPWINDLGEFLGSMFLSYLIIFGIAVIPGFINAFLLSSLFFDRRPPRKLLDHYPDMTIVVAAFNEEESIESTLHSIDVQSYPGNLKVLVVDDGSTDSTADIVRAYSQQHPYVELLRYETNRGKHYALNFALAQVRTELFVTIDADSYLYRDALRRLVERYMADPDSTAACAGAVLVRNSRNSFIAKIQEWDYFHGIATVKRVQSFYQGTLVAQGAFTIYSTEKVREVGGWKNTVGEDIVLTWDLLSRGYRIGYAEDACLFTNVPSTLKALLKQRLRWSRGMIEGFKYNWPLLFKPTKILPFFWFNALFPYLDIVYVLVFLPGIIAALFGFNLIAGPMTLILLPMAMMVNYTMFVVQSRMFTSQGLKVRKNILGFMIYALFYGFILQPACVWGYLKELFNGRTKSWHTK